MIQTNIQQTSPSQEEIPSSTSSSRPLWEVIEEIATGIPDEEWAKLPGSGSNHPEQIPDAPSVTSVGLGTRIHRRFAALGGLDISLPKRTPSRPPPDFSVTENS